MPRPPVEPDDLLVVQPEHRVVQPVEPVVHCLPVASVGPAMSVLGLGLGQGLCEIAPGGVDHEVLAPDSLGELGQEESQDAVSVPSSLPGVGLNAAPALPEGDLDGLVPGVPQPDIALARRSAAGFGAFPGRRVPAVLADAAQAVLHLHGEGPGVSGPLQRRAGLPEVERLGLPDVLVGGVLLHVPYEVLLHARGVLVPVPGVAGNALVDEAGDGLIVVQDVGLVEHLEHALHLLAAQGCEVGQLVGRDALVRGGVQDPAYYVQRLVSGDSVHSGYPFQALPGGALVGHLQAGRVNPHLVFQPGGQGGLFQPGDRGPDPGIVADGVPLEVALGVFGQDLARGGHDVRLLLLRSFVQSSECPEDALDLLSADSGVGVQGKLLLRVLRGVEEDAPGVLLVPAGPAGLLHIVLQRAGYVAVQHQADVRLVNSHAKSVRCGQDPEVPRDESFLGLALFVRAQPGVKVAGLHSRAVQEAGDVLGVPAPGAVDDGAAVRLTGQLILQHLPDVVHLGGVGGLHHHEVQVLPLGASVQHFQAQVEGLGEVAGDLPFHVGLGRGGEA